MSVGREARSELGPRPRPAPAPSRGLKQGVLSLRRAAVFEAGRASLGQPSPFHPMGRPRFLCRSDSLCMAQVDTCPAPWRRPPEGWGYGNVSPAAGGALKRIWRSGLAPRLISGSRRGRGCRPAGCSPWPRSGDPRFRRRHLLISRGPLSGAGGARPMFHPGAAPCRTPSCRLKVTDRV